MPRDPFAALTRRTRWQARLLSVRDRLLRPLRPGRIDPTRPGPPNLLLVGVDTLRADHLGCYGYGQPTSPRLDQLAANGTLFADAGAAAPWTLPSFATALTGLMPGLHGGYLGGPVRNMDSQPPQPLRPDVVTLAAHLRGQGYRTAAFYSNQFFAFGLAESFDRHEYHNLPAQDVVRLAIEWMRQRADRPFFCFVLLNDPHEPTTPPATDLAPFLPRLSATGAPTDAAALRNAARWGDTTPLGAAPCPPDASTARAVAVKIAVYDATVRQVDRALGALQDFLTRHELDGVTLTSVFSDHGEEFLDHQAEARGWNHDPRNLHGIGHGQSHFHELLHVPWAAWGPGVPAAVRRTEPVSLLDLAPTLLEWLGVPPLPRPSRPLPPGADSLIGRSRAARPRIDVVSSGLVLSEAIAYGPDLVALRQDRYKLIAHRDGRVLALYDLAVDPAETSDRQHDLPAVRDELLAAAAAWRATGLGATDVAGPEGGNGPASWSDLDDTVRNRLKDLGYSD